MAVNRYILNAQIFLIELYKTGYNDYVNSLIAQTKWQYGTYILAVAVLQICIFKSLMNTVERQLRRAKAIIVSLPFSLIKKNEELKGYMMKMNVLKSLR